MLILTTLKSMLGRRGNVLGALVAHALAVSIMLGAILVLLSTFHGPGATDRLAATDLIVRPDLTAMFDSPEDSVPQGMHIRLSATQIDVIAQVEGVDRVVRDVTFPAQVLDAAGVPVAVSEQAVPRGQSWESAALTPFVLMEGNAPESVDEIVVDSQTAQAANLSVGGEARVVTNQFTRTYRVSGIALPGSGSDLDRQSSIFFAPAPADELSRSGGSADLLGVFVTDGWDVDAVADDIRRTSDGMDVQVLAGDDRAKADVTAGALDVTEFGVVLGVLCGFVGFVSIFVLSSTFGFSIQQREREIGLQRAIGYTPRQAGRMVLIEVLAIATVGSAIGLVAGTLLSQVFVWIAAWFDKVPESFSVSFSALGAAIVLAASYGIAILAAWLAGRRVAKIQPIEALRSAAAPGMWIGWRRLLTGLCFIGGSVVAVALSASLPPDAAIAMSLLVTALLTIGCAILGASLVAPLVRLVSPFFQTRARVTGDVAVSNTRRMAARVASATTPVLLAVGFMTLMFGFTLTIETATIRITTEREQAEIFALPMAHALPHGAETLVAAIPGVDRASAITSMPVSYAWSDSTMSADAVIIDPSAVETLEAMTFSSGGLEGFGRGSVIISNMLDYSGTTGSVISVIMNDGSIREFTVAGEATNLLGLGDILMTPTDASAVSVDMMPRAIAVSLLDDADPEAVISGIEALSAQGYPLQALTHDEYVSGVRQSLQDDVWANYLIIGGAAAFGIVAVVNTLTMATSERAREFALMRLIGATRKQVLQVLGKEAAIVSAIGLVLGWGIAIASTVPVSIGLVGDVSAVRMPILPLLGTGLIGVIVIFAAILIPGNLALRRQPMTEIGSKE